MHQYQINTGSQSVHCCFKYTVVDATKPHIIGGVHYQEDGQFHYDIVCECFNKKSAELICDALNGVVK